MTLFLPTQLYYDLLNKVDRDDLALLSLSIPYQSSRKAGLNPVAGVLIPRAFPDDLIFPSSKIKLEGRPSADNKEIFEALGYTMPPSASAPVRSPDLGMPAPAPAAIPVQKFQEVPPAVAPAAPSPTSKGCSLVDELRPIVTQLEVLTNSLKGLVARMDECRDE